MAKSLDQLSDRKLSSTPAPTSEAESTLALCRELLDDPRYQWAWGTVSGIREVITATGRSTEGQRNALNNIQRGGDRERDRQRRFGRRYEGF